MPRKVITVLQDVKRIIDEKLGVGEQNITENSHLVNDFGADSLDLVELIMAAEQEFNIAIPDQDMSSPLLVVGEAVTYLKANGVTDKSYMVYPGQPYPTPTSLDYIRKRTVEIIADKFGLPASSVGPDHRFIDEYEADQIDMWDLLVDFSQEFELYILDDEIEALVKVSDAVKLISDLYRYKDLSNSMQLVMYALPVNKFAIRVMRIFADAVGLEYATDVYPVMRIDDHLTNKTLAQIWNDLSAGLLDLGVTVAQNDQNLINTFGDFYEFVQSQYFAGNPDPDYFPIYAGNITQMYDHSFPWPVKSIFPNPIFDLVSESDYPAPNTATTRQKKIAVGLLRFMEKLDQEKEYPGSSTSALALRQSTIHSDKVFRQSMEYVCEYLKDIGVTTSYQAMTVPELIGLAENPVFFTEVGTPDAGDIYITTDENESEENFHVGVVRTFSRNPRLITVLDEYSYGLENSASATTVNLRSPHLNIGFGYRRFFRPNI